MTKKSTGAGYKGNIPSSLLGKLGAAQTKLMILKGRKVEAMENEEAFDDNQIIDAENAVVEAQAAIEAVQQVSDIKRRKVA